MSHITSHVISYITSHKSCHEFCFYYCWTKLPVHCDNLLWYRVEVEQVWGILWVLWGQQRPVGLGSNNITSIQPRPALMTHIFYWLLHESIHPTQPARCVFSLPLGCHPVRPSTIYTVCPILESVAYHHHRSHCKGIPPNAICITLSSVGSQVPATEPRWQIKWVHQRGFNPRLQHSRLTC